MGVSEPPKLCWIWSYLLEHIHLLQKHVWSQCCLGNESLGTHRVAKHSIEHDTGRECHEEKHGLVAGYGLDIDADCVVEWQSHGSRILFCCVGVLWHHAIARIQFAITERSPNDTFMEASRGGVVSHRHRIWIQADCFADGRFCIGDCVRTRLGRCLF